MINMLFFMTVILIAGFNMPWGIYVAATLIWLLNLE